MLGSCVRAGGERGEGRGERGEGRGEEWGGGKNRKQEWVCLRALTAGAGEAQAWSDGGEAAAEDAEEGDDATVLTAVTMEFAPASGSRERIGT